MNQSGATIKVLITEAGNTTISPNILSIIIISFQMLLLFMHQLMIKKISCIAFNIPNNIIYNVTAVFSRYAMTLYCINVKL